MAKINKVLKTRTTHNWTQLDIKIFEEVKKAAAGHSFIANNTEVLREGIRLLHEKYVTNN